MPNSRTIEVQPYSALHERAWNAFVNDAKNGHFFFQRGFMEYHADRFTDLSLMFTSSGRLVAVLPANLADDSVWSHQGLTYGGLIVNDEMTAELMLDVFDAMLAAARAQGASRIVYKCMPYIYFREPSEEDRYALFRHNARLTRRELSSAIDIGHGTGRYTKGKRANLAKAAKARLRVAPLRDPGAAIDLVDAVLQERHGIRPVHTREELSMLATRFPANICAFGAFRDDTLLATTVVFVNEGVVHTQYMANSQAGRELGALDFLIDTLVRHEYAEKRYWSFGISTEDGGSRLNTGLLHAKEAFGARAVVHDTYEVAL
jgi:hypothetical protein